MGNEKISSGSIHIKFIDFANAQDELGRKHMVSIYGTALPNPRDWGVWTAAGVTENDIGYALALLAEIVGKMRVTGGELEERRPEDKENL